MLNTIVIRDEVCIRLQIGSSSKNKWEDFPSFRIVAKSSKTYEFMHHAKKRICSRKMRERFRKNSTHFDSQYWLELKNL